MTVTRMVGLLAGLTLLGVAVVTLRVEQSIHSRRIQQLQFRQAELRQKLWSQELELARLRSPRVIRQRAEQLGAAASAADASEGEIRPLAARP